MKGSGMNMKMWEKEYRFWVNKNESSLKREIKLEKNPFRKAVLQDLYEKFKREGTYDDQRAKAKIIEEVKNG